MAYEPWIKDSTIGFQRAGNGYTVTRDPNSDTYASDTFGDIIRADYNDYRSRFRPQEQRLMSLAESEELLSAQLSRITANSAKRFKQSAVNTSMNNAKYGQQPSQRAQQSINNQRNLQQGLITSQSMNDSRLAADERRLGVMSGSSNSRYLAQQKQQG